MYQKIAEQLKELDYPEGKTFGRGKSFAQLKKEIIEATNWIKFDGKEKFNFRLYCIVNDITTTPTCKHPECNNEVKVIQNLIDKGTKVYDSYRFADYCSRKCMQSSPLTLERRTATMEERYGGHNMQTEKGQKEFKDAMMKKYGVDNPMKVGEIAERASRNSRSGDPEVLAKVKKSYEERFVGGHPMRDPAVLEKFRETSREKYGVDNHAQKHISEETLRILNDKQELSALMEEHKFLFDVAQLLGVHFSSVQRSCAKLGIDVRKHTSSRGETQIEEFLMEHNVRVEKNRRDLIPSRLEIDIFCPDHGVAIEFNGIYWHSSIFKKRCYHQDKSIECQENGIMLVHVWEDDWNDPIRKEIIKKKILSKLGLGSERIFARKTTVCEVPYKEARNFMKTNHIQGATTATVWVGLRDQDGELVACLGCKRTDINGHYDIVRYATSKTVVGGFSKCLKFLESLIDDWSYLFTYASLDYGNGNLYEKTGFEAEYITVPDMWYVKGDKRYRREGFMKHKLKNLLPDFDESLTEKMNLENHGYIPLYGSGSIRYSKRR